MADHKIPVRYFQRKPRKGFNFSLEYIFNDIRNQLKDKISASEKISAFYNNGYLSKIGNIIQAAFMQSKYVNHITGEVHFLNLLMRKKTVITTVLDCGFMYRKQGFAKKLINIIYLKWPEKKSAFLTAISSETKKEVIQYTGCSPDKIYVIPVAVHPMYQPFNKSFNKEKPVILHIGTGYNKNLLRTAEALKSTSCRLNIIGRLSVEVEEKLKLYNLDYCNFYNLSQPEMLEQYHNCDILSFISTFEGFGMPIVEAQCVERPVITSKISSMPEVAGEAACLVDPYNVEDMRNGFLRIINDDAYRKLLIEKGKENRKRYDARNIAMQYYHLYEEVYKSIQS